MALFRQTERHYGGAAAVIPGKAEHTFAVFMAATDGPRLLIARIGDQIAGYAAFTRLLPGSSPQGTLFLKDLFVSETVRGGGVGRALMAAVADYALANGFTRLDWTADADAERTLAFYRGLGAEQVTDKLVFRAETDMMKSWVENRPDRQDR